jgi:hypothetical protein
MKRADGFPLQPNPACPVCNSPAIAAAGSMVELGASASDVAIALQVDIADVEQHFAQCVPLDVTPKSASDAELDALIRHGRDLYRAASIQNALVASASALSVSLRALAEKSNREQDRAKKESLLDGADPHAPTNTWPDALQKFVGAYIDGILERIPAGSSQNENEVNK